MKKNTVNQLNYIEIEQVHGGHKTGDHHHIFGFYSHKITSMLSNVSLGLATLYMKKPRLAQTLTLIMGIGAVFFIAHKLIIENPAPEKRKRDL